MCESIIAECISNNTPYDVIALDFQKAFDKIPHSVILSELRSKGITGKALSWFTSFLQDRTQCVRIGSSVSKPTSVVSGVIQGSVVGAGLFTIVLDSLLRQLKLPAPAFADDLKFVADLKRHSTADVQEDLNTVGEWSDAHCMPLSIEKSFVMHCGARNTNHDYSLQGKVLRSTDTMRDLGITRSASGKFNQHIAEVISSTAKLSGAILKAFRERPASFPWQAFKTYVMPLLMYASPVWCPTSVWESDAVENIQRRFTKRLMGYYYKPYAQRLIDLHAMSLEDTRRYSDMIMLFKFFHGICGCTLEDIGLSRMPGVTRGAGVRVRQKAPSNCLAASKFSYRAASYWNSLPLSLTSDLSLCSFKRHLKSYFVLQMNNNLNEA